MGLPKYMMIRNHLMEKIEKMDVDTPIESERELALKYDVSRMTVRNAINELVNEGYLYRNKNKGTFIADKKETLNLGPASSSFLDLYNNEDVEYILIYYSVKKLPEISVRLDLKEDDLILRLVRLTKENNIAKSVDEIYYDYSYIKDFDVRNIYKLMNLSEYAKNGKLVQKITASIIPDKYANLLDIGYKLPGLLIESVIHQKDGKPIIYVKSYHSNKESIELTL